MSDKEYSAYKLLNAPGFGVKSIFYIYNILRRLGFSINDLFEQDMDQLKANFPEIGRGKFSRADFHSFQSLDSDQLYASYQKLKDEGVHIIGLDDERYPKTVLEKLGDNAPSVLFCKGYLPLLNADSISIVGSREVSDFAIMLTKRIANRLAENGYNVVSGFAKGVDTSAHIGALESNGTTSMVLSYGFNHLSIKKDIKAYNWERNTLFVSQFMPFEKFSGQNAMIRNKLVCALSKAVIVISSGPERDGSGKMSGTFDAGITAIKHNIPLFVLSPSLLSPIPQGNIDLIKMGGISLANGNELVEYLNRIKLKEEESSSVDLIQVIDEPEFSWQPTDNDIKAKILQSLSGKMRSIDEIFELIKVNWTRNDVLSYLEKMDDIESVKKKGNIFYKRKKIDTQTSLF